MFVSTIPLEMGYHLPGIEGILLVGLPPSPTSLQQFAGRVTQGGTAQGTAHVLVPSDPLKDFKWQFDWKKNDTEREQVKTDFVLMHAFLRSSGCKWRIILDHFSEIMLDDCGHCSSCTSPIVPQVITDVLHALHEAFRAMEGTHFDKPMWEGSLLDLLMRKHNAKLKSDYPAHARAVLRDVGQQFPQLTRANWASALWHGVEAGVLSIEHELCATCASVVYTAGDSTPFNEGAHFMAKLKGQVRPPTTSQEGDSLNVGDMTVPHWFELDDITEFFSSSRVARVEEHETAMDAPGYVFTDLSVMPRVTGDLVYSAMCKFRDETCFVSIAMNASNKILHSLGGCCGGRCDHGCALALQLQTTDGTPSTSGATSDASSVKSGRKQRATKAQAMPRMRQLVRHAEAGRHCIVLEGDHVVYPPTNVVLVAHDVYELKGGSSTSLVSHVQATKNGHNAGFFGDGFGRENLHYERWVCCGAYHCSQNSPNTPPADKRTHKRNAVCSHGAMVKKPCENLMFYHIHLSIDGVTPDDNDPLRLPVAVDISTLDIPSWEEQQAMLATFDRYDRGGDWPGHLHGKVPRFKGNEALDKFFLKLFADDERLTPAEAIGKTTPSGKTAVQEDSMYKNLVHIRYLKERAKLSSEEKASHALFFSAEHVADTTPDLPEGCSLYIRHDSRYPMMDQPLFMTPRMLDIARRERYHEVDATFLKGKEYK